MSHLVTIQPSQRSYTVAEGETLLTAAIRQGINLPYGCKDGACGSCKCEMLAGTVTHAAYQSKALSPEEQARGLVLTCRATPASDVVLTSRQVAAQGAFPVKKMPARVARLERLADGVIRLLLQLPANEAFSYHAGQYVDVLLKDGQRRSYSMANAPHRLADGLELHLRHMPGGLFTDWVFEGLKERDILRLEGPFGDFHLRESDPRPVILLASGTGFAPIKAVLEHVHHKRSTRPFALYWGARRPADLYLRDWVLAQQAQMPQLTFVPVVSDALPEDGWRGRTGFVHLAVLQDHPDLSGHQVYACGAPVVIASAQRDYLAAGLSADAFFADAFTSMADKADA